MEYLRPKFPSHRSTLRSFYLRLCLSWRVLQVCLLLLCANFGVDRLTSFCLTRDQTLGVFIYSRTRSYHCCTLHSHAAVIIIIIWSYAMLDVAVYSICLDGRFRGGVSINMGVFTPPFHQRGRCIKPTL